MFENITTDLACSVTALRQQQKIGKAMTLSVRSQPLFNRKNYSAGACFPLCAPFGYRAQLPAVNELMEEAVVPQYLHVYRDFSLPSYNLCFPLCAPLGWRAQLPAVNELTEDAEVPQYSQ